ncbi:hypothetical protein [Mesorhizobium sp. M0676]|uniref:zinc-binding dehydrogenase n=1 Tax=Mesorhizobium sp. M0676 TaxID=2956984 RepID=UPI00333BCB77
MADAPATRQQSWPAFSRPGSAERLVSAFRSASVRSERGDALLTDIRFATSPSPCWALFTIGFVTGAEATVDLLPIIIKALKVVGNNTGSVSDLRAAVRAIAAARIGPVVDKVFSQEQAAEAYAHMSAGGQHFGKLAFKLDW